jgi:GntR family transcriptional regulator / MocR family aminotransferase
MSLPRRLELIRWAEQRNGVIIEDDYCSEYRYSGPPLPSLQGLAGGVPVIYIGTFSKVLYPGLRIGYVVAPPELAPRFARAKWLADRHTPVLEQCALADFLGEGHLERHIRRMRRLYGLRREVLLDSLDRHFRDRVTVRGDAAGMHALVRFHEEGVLARALANKVQLVCSDGYYLMRPPGGEVLMGSRSKSSVAEGDATGGRSPRAAATALRTTSGSEGLEITQETPQVRARALASRSW